MEEEEEAWWGERGSASELVYTGVMGEVVARRGSAVPEDSRCIMATAPGKMVGCS